MYLTYSEYVSMGGELDNTAFSLAERKATGFINSQAHGKCGERLRKAKEIPEGVKNAVFDLILYDIANPDKQISSESQSMGGISESISYKTKAENEKNTERYNIIHYNFYGFGLGNLLFLGVLDDD